MGRNAVNYRCLLSLACIALCGGCIPLPSKGQLQGPIRRANQVEPAEVRELHVVWNDALLEFAGKPHTRGFAARAYLFTDRSKAPVLSNGTFLFFAWQEPESADQTKVKPDRTWTFSPEQVAQLARPDSIGWGYTFWLPWGPAGGGEAKFTLRAAFRGDNGKVLLSDPATVVLPGKPRPLAEFRKLDELRKSLDRSNPTPSTRSETISLELPRALR